MADIAQGVDEEVTQEIQNKVDEKKRSSRHVQRQPQPHLGRLPVNQDQVPFLQTVRLPRD